MAKHNALKALVSFDGRTRRRDWWLIWIGLAVIQTSLWALLSKMIFGAWPSLLDPSLSQGEAALSLGVLLIFLWPFTALSMRRAHDRDKSGWLVLVSAPLAIADGIAMLIAPDLMMSPMAPPFSTLDIAKHVFTSVYLIIGFWLLITLGFLDGTSGPNRYGPSPKGIGQKDEVSLRVD